MEEIEMVGTKTTVRRSRSAATESAAPKKAPARPRVAKAKAPVPAEAVTSLPPAERQRRIEIAAYFRAERRGFAPGQDWADWLAAEAEIEAWPPEPAAAPPDGRAKKKATPAS